MASKPTLYSRLFPKQPLYPKVTHCHMPVFDTVRMGALHARRRALQDGIKAIDAELARLVELEQLKAFAHYQQVLMSHNTMDGVSSPVIAPIQTVESVRGDPMNPWAAPGAGKGHDPHTHAHSGFGMSQ